MIVIYNIHAKLWPWRRLSPFSLRRLSIYGQHHYLAVRVLHYLRIDVIFVYGWKIETKNEYLNIYHNRDEDKIKRMSFKDVVKKLTTVKILLN